MGLRDLFVTHKELDKTKRELLTTQLEYIQNIRSVKSKLSEALKDDPNLLRATNMMLDLLEKKIRSVR